MEADRIKNYFQSLDRTEGMNMRGNNTGVSPQKDNSHRSYDMSTKKQDQSLGMLNTTGRKDFSRSVSPMNPTQKTIKGQSGMVET